ncbi:MAG: cell surface protein SprA, partial [Bacteroidota bacterium]
NDIEELVDLYSNNRLVASQILGEGVHAEPGQAAEGYTAGYGNLQQDVLTSAFIAAYRGEAINSVGVQNDFVRQDIFDQLPIPNWRLTYNGLSKVPAFQEIFQSVNIQHGYQSELTINSFKTNLLFEPGALNNDGSFYSRLEIPEIAIQESFAPLIGIDIRTQNDISLRAAINRSRTLAMSFVNSQLAETQSQDYQFGFGWLMSDVNIGFLRNIVNNNPKKKKKADSDRDPLNFPGNNRGGNRGGGGGGANVGDLDININFSLRDDVTYNHLLDQGFSEPTRGTKQISFSPAAEYQMHEKLALRIFFDYTKTIPRLSTSFPTSNAAGGIVVRFTLNE